MVVKVIHSVVCWDVGGYYEFHRLTPSQDLYRPDQTWIGQATLWRHSDANLKQKIYQVEIKNCRLYQHARKIKILVIKDDYKLSFPCNKSNPAMLMYQLVQAEKLFIRVNFPEETNKFLLIILVKLRIY